MAKQTTVTNSVWAMGVGTAFDSQGNQFPVRAAVFTDPQTGEVFQFPLPIEEAEKFGEAMRTGEEKIQDHHPDLAVARQMPPKKTLDTMKDPAQAAKEAAAKIPGGVPGERRERE